MGTDIVHVEDVRRSVAEHSDHYLERVYTRRELEDCRGPQGLDAERLAGRFAAKEATLKVLRPADEGVPWTAIEVRRDAAGWVWLALSGPAAKLAAAAGLGELSLSIAHDGGFATAVVVAECPTDSPPVDR